jgi:acyl-coenzyme A thioesterase PaaI-like protein
VEYGDPLGDGTAEELADALRRLMDTAVVTSADDSELRRAIEAIDQISDALAGADDVLLRPAMPWATTERMQRGDRPHNPVMGPANPLAPPLPVTILADRSISSEVIMRPIHEGPPGTVHGGWVAALFDQLLGVANIVNGTAGMTAELTVRYRRSTPLGVPLLLKARIDEVDGRRTYASGEIIADGVVTAEATGLFISPTAERVEALRRTRERHQNAS